MKITGTLTIVIDGDELVLTTEQARELRDALIKELGDNQSWPVTYPSPMYPLVGDSGESPLLGHPVVCGTHTEGGNQ